MKSRQANVLLAPFLEHARRAPQDVAVRTRDTQLSYAELANEVLRLAAALDDLAIGPDDIVALGTERTPKTIALILAITANGAAYLPLEATHPETRLAAMIEDAQPLLAIVERPLQVRLPPRGVHVERAALATSRIISKVKRSGALAYVLFTSGSTGRPKGVAMRTTAVEALLQWQSAHARLGKPARTLQFAPFGFDVSFQEIFSTLWTGGTLLLPSAAERRDPWALLELLRRERIERLFLPYVSLQALADAAAGTPVADNLADVITAGEQLRITPGIRAFFAARPGCVLHNQYGPTETHVVTAHELHGNAELWPELPPIGTALPHVRTRIEPLLDETGSEGELLLGGACLAEGYIGQPELTAARFVQLDGERWYRSGDRVHLNPNGEFDYLGRIDEQIKIAGHRVEPAEIENVLCRHSAVAQVAVVAEERRSGRRLIAHVVPHGLIEAEVVQKLLAAYCAAALPEYLQPHAFQLHVALPTTASGKIDRLALTSAEPSEVPWDDDLPLRDQLLRLWQCLLGVDGLQLSANVFDIGARSLDVVQALTELRRHGHGITVAQVYENPTIAAQLELLEGNPRIEVHADSRASRQRAAWARLAGARR